MGKRDDGMTLRRVGKYLSPRGQKSGFVRPGSSPMNMRNLANMMNEIAQDVKGSFLPM